MTTFCFWLPSLPFKLTFSQMGKPWQVRYQACRCQLDVLYAQVPVPDIRAHMQKRVDKAKASWPCSSLSHDGFCREGEHEIMTCRPDLRTRDYPGVLP